MKVTRTLGTVLFAFILSIFSIFLVIPKKRTAKKKNKVISKTGNAVKAKGSLFV